ncbi:GNAT family protein [Paenibacillus campi]|uniref:GNAT family N-acetyltransferase n=1 Tax=Paenibacillus campi TaxID=3106031 RepID=UPI002AFF9EA1|nr:GNAT family protein [Paenibacillus sp. SGZ-1009]
MPNHPTSSHPILLDIPNHFESKRLLIRAPQPGDGAAMNEAIRTSINELQPWMPWAQQLPTVQQSEANLRLAQVQFMERRDLRLLLLDKQTGQFVGSSGLHAIDWQVRKFEIGYWVSTAYAGQGYISEAVRAITEFAIERLQANRIEIRCDARNVSSARVAERCGYTLEGTLRNHKLDTQGSLRHTLIFAKVRGAEYE